MTASFFNTPIPLVLGAEFIAIESNPFQKLTLQWIDSRQPDERIHILSALANKTIELKPYSPGGAVFSLIQYMGSNYPSIQKKLVPFKEEVFVYIDMSMSLREKKNFLYDILHDPHHAFYYFFRISRGLLQPSIYSGMLSVIQQKYLEYKNTLETLNSFEMEEVNFNEINNRQMRNL